MAKVVEFGVKLAAVLLVAGLVSACTLKVEGQNADGSERFSGTATGSMDGSGVLTITSTKGRSCTGNFVYETKRKGAGNFTCSDGSSGPFTFSSTGMSGVGSGSIGGQAFTFTFG